MQKIGLPVTRTLKQGGKGGSSPSPDYLLALFAIPIFFAKADFFLALETKFAFTPIEETGPRLNSRLVC